MSELKDKNKVKYLFSFILLIFLMWTFYLLTINIYFEMIKLDNKEKQIFVERLNTNKIVSNEKETKYIREIAGYNVIAILEIPEIDIMVEVLEEYSEKALKISVTKFFGPEPNEVGNFCISGHNYKISGSSMFSELKKIKINDEIFLKDVSGQKVKYEVYDVFKVYPNMTSSLSQKTEGRKELTLITCTLDSQKRIIVKAKEAEEI